MNITSNSLNVSNIGISQNEYMSRFPVNRNIERLVENDVTLYDKQNQAVASVIRDFSQNETYDSGSLVWFMDKYRRVWLLRKIVNYTGLSDNPNDAVKNACDDPEFELHGWKNENEYIDLSSYGVIGKLSRQVEQSVYEHECDEDLHRYGKLQTESDLSCKFSRIDVSNIDPSRDSTFFPYKTVRLTADSAIINGYARIWDNGLLEYDITYRFGYCGEDEAGYEILTCNNVIFSMAGIRDNQKYFNSVDDASIFYYKNESDQNFSKVQDTIQKNRNDYVNTYFADIKFPSLSFETGGRKMNIRFGDSQYMIFGSGVMSHDADFGKKCVNASPNQITYCNRTYGGFTALLITFPSNQYFGENSAGYNATHGGLVSNTFHCSVIGKWEAE